MFETVDELNQRLPRPGLTGDQKHDAQVRDLYIDNAKALRSAAFASLGRAIGRAFHDLWRRPALPTPMPQSHQA